MDRSFLSRDAVIEASRKFVCIRLPTYEDRTEVNFLKTLHVSYTGEIANTVFALLAPDGKTKLSAADRSPAQVFGGVPNRRSDRPGAAELNEAAARKLAERMEAIARTHPGKDGEAGLQRALPRSSNLRMAVNIAACDNQPLLVLFSEKPEELKAMEKALQPVAWSEGIVGRAVYVTVRSAAEYSRLVRHKEPSAGFVLAAPEAYGRHAVPLLKLAPTTAAAELQKELRAMLALYNPPPKDSDAHEAAGLEAGIRWRPKTPITDRSRARRGGGRGSARGRGRGTGRRKP